MIGLAHMRRMCIGIAVHGDGLDAELPARANDAEGDFSAVRDQDTGKHRDAFKSICQKCEIRNAKDCEPRGQWTASTLPMPFAIRLFEGPDPCVTCIQSFGGTRG